VRKRSLCCSVLPRALCVAILAWSASVAVTPALEHLDGIIAVVGDEPILYSELEAYALMRLSENKVKPDSADAARLQREFLDELVEGKVLLVHARKDTTIRVSSRDVDAAVEEHIAQLLASNNISMDQLESELGRQELTLARFRVQLRRSMEEQLLRRNVQQRYVAAVDVSRRDVEAFFARYRDSLPPLGESARLLKLAVTLAPPDSVRQAAFTKIKKIKQRLDNGESFDAVARLYSEDANAAAGGDLGFIAKGSLSELAFEEAVFALQPGQVGEPFETRLGFHIATVLAKKDQRVHVKQIFVSVAPPGALKEATVARLDSIRGACRDTAAFAQAVRLYCTDAQLRSRGGDAGWFVIAMLPQELRDAFDTLAPGVVSRPVSDNNTFSLYFVADHVENRPLNLARDWDLVAEKARDITAQEKLAELVKRWRQEIYIDIRL
jgi:peptidyl-prolyl cis-trans isomerase SurA